MSLTGLKFYAYIPKSTELQEKLEAPPEIGDTEELFKEYTKQAYSTLSELTSESLSAIKIDADVKQLCRHHARLELMTKRATAEMMMGSPEEFET